jgi:hypothetical protein
MLLDGFLAPGTLIRYLGPSWCVGDATYLHLQPRRAAHKQSVRLSKTNLVGRALHQHKLHFSDVYRLRRDHAGRIFLKNDGFVFHKGE